MGGKDKMKEYEYYVEFSLDQDCFHVDTMRHIQETNIDLCKRGINNGYVIIAGPLDMESACAKCEEFNYLKRRNVCYENLTE